MSAKESMLNSVITNKRKSLDLIDLLMFLEAIIEYNRI